MKKNKDNSKILSANLFPVVGIGASAGGLEAFKKLLKAIPEDSGMAYVLVQHLDPNHESILPELLQRVTTIPVVEIADDMRVEPDHIYVIPSNKMMVANDGVLELTTRPEKNKTDRNLPIDLFFVSLSEVHQNHAIGIVLSGTASDGTLGLKAIKDHGGVTFAQDEESATYKEMPLNAAQAGVVDFILPPEKIPQKILEIIGIINGKSNKEQNLPHSAAEVFKQITLLLRLRKGTDFTYYKQTTIRRRILRRMALNKNEIPADYLNYLRDNKAEQDFLYQDLLISVTTFFRDHKIFDNLCETVFPLILKNNVHRIANRTGGNETIRIWVAGCSTGEEAYSIAICLKELLGNEQERVQIFATDISEIAINKARAGIYTKNDIQELSAQRLQEFFSKNKEGYQVNKEIRDMCVFALHNFIKDPPFGKMDFVSCRNVLIYMEPYLQKKALTNFHYSLNPKGTLLLGKSETINDAHNLFSSISKSDKIFLRNDVPGRFLYVASQKNESNPILTNTGTVRETSRNNFEKAADDILLREFTPAGVVVNESMNIVYFRGNTASYLEQSPGKPSHNLLVMAKQGLSFELRNILHKAKKDRQRFLKENIPVQVNNELRTISIEVIPLSDMIDLHYLVLFHTNKSAGGKPPPIDEAIAAYQTVNDDKDIRIRQLEQELVLTREDMRSITEDQEAANEELQSANEELLSGSEEMQSLNEELETSKEELQNSNEELVTVNQEMIGLNEQITAAKDYSQNIIANIRESLLVLDINQRVVSANASFYKTFRLNERETEGVLIYELGDKEWDIPALRILLEKIITESSIFNDFEVTHSFSRIGERSMLLNARSIINDKGQEKLILLSIEDITERKKAQEILKRSSEYLQQLVKELPAGVYSCDTQGYITFFNKAAAKLWGREPEPGKEKWCGSWKMFKPDGSPLAADSCPMAITVKEGRQIVGEEIIIERPDGSRSNVMVYPQPEYSLSGEVIGAVNMVIDITEEVKVKTKIEESEKRYHNMIYSSPSLIAILQGEKLIVSVANNSILEHLGMGKEIIGKPFLLSNPELENQGIGELLRKVYKTGVAYQTHEAPLHFTRKGKRELSYYNYVIQPQLLANGKIDGLAIIANDVTEQVIAKKINLENRELREKELEEKVMQRTAELSETNEELQIKNQEIALSKYNKRFLTEFSEKFSAYKVHNEFFNSLVQFIADSTHLDNVFVGKLEQTPDRNFTIQTIAISSLGNLTDNINLGLRGGPWEQLEQGILYSFPKHCRQLFPQNKTIEEFKVEGYLGYSLNDGQGNAVGIIAVMHENEIEDVETVSSILKIVARRAEIELERITYEQQLVQSNTILLLKNEELLKLNKELEAFTYISSHDLQEPLRKIQTFVNRILIKENDALSENGKNYLNRIQNAALRMQTLILDLLAYLRTNLKEHKLDYISLNEIVEDIITELSEVISEKKAVIEIGDLGYAHINPVQFKLVISNLVTNALKFCKPDIPPQITIEGRIDKGFQFGTENQLLDPGALLPQESYCQISVTDNGIGFEPQYRKQIFEVFQRLYGKDEYPGTGIGLAIVKKIVENHKGVITAKGELHKGATLNIYIPA